MTAPFPPPNDPEPLDPNLLTTMYQDLLANRPLEFEVYLGNPLRMAEAFGLHCPNLSILYGIARHMNRSRTKSDSARSPLIPQVRQATSQPRQSMVNGRGRGLGPRSVSDGPVVNGRGRPTPTNGYKPPHRRGSLEGDLDQFKDIAMYGENLGDETSSPNGEDYRARPPPSRIADLELRNRELMLRERELQIREREMELANANQRRPPPRIRHNNIPSTIMDDDEDDEDARPPVSQRQLMMSENFDMMSVTGRRARNAQVNKSAMKGRGFEGPPAGSGGRLMSLGGGRKGRSPSMVSQATFDPLNENPLMSFTSNRYPGVDTRTLTASSRANSLTSQRMDELGMAPGTGRTASMLGNGGGAYPAMSRGPPGAIPGPGVRGPPPMTTRGRPLPPQEFTPNPGRGYSDPPPAVLAPGIPPKDGKVRSTTGSASASSASLGGNGESHSSSSSLEPPIHQTRF
jgi:hypothetical protein